MGFAASEAAVALFRGRGDGGLYAWGSLPAGFAVRSLALGDVDGDGRADLALGAPAKTDLALLLGNGDGTFRATGDFGIDRATRDDLRGGATAVALRDADRDGALDLLVGGPDRRDFSVFPGDGHGRFGPRRRFIGNRGSTAGASFTTADADGDGLDDVLLIGSSGIYLLRGTDRYRCW